MRLLVVVWVLLLAACTSSPDTEPSVGEPTMTGEPSASPRPTLGPSSEQPVREDTLTGTLGADSVEGGCGYLETPDGTRYEVIYPPGWELSVSPLELKNPDGEIVARGGDEVTVHGAETQDMASICQIGPIFEATSVED